MNKKTAFILFLTVQIAFLQLGMGRSADQYDQEAREAEKAMKQMDEDSKAQEKRTPLKNMASGIKEATVDSTKGLISETAEETTDRPPVIGTLDGARKGTGKALDSTVKGIGKIATFGYGDADNYTVEEPKANTNEPTKVKIKF